jgi:glycosyltransferase involved in cell wall biosynthesis
MKDRLVQSVPSIKSRVVVVRNAANFDLVPEVNSPNNFNASHGIDSVRDVICISYIGALSHHKGLSNLLTTVERIPLTCLESFKINIAGDGPMRSSVMEIALKYENIKYLGKIDGEIKKQFYCEADIVVVPSIWYENASVVIVEALSSGCFVVASRIGGNPELIESGYNGFLYDPHSIDDLGKAITDCVRLSRDSSPTARTIRARTFGEKNSLATMTQSYLDLFSGQ